MTRIAVVIPWYDDQPGLDRVLAGLDGQTVPARDVEIVVADDGSPKPPSLGGRAHAISTAYKEDRGFRAAAARDLGVRRTSAPLLAFLDADTVPEPGYLQTLIESLSEPSPVGIVAVGRRRHADLAGCTAADVTRWLAGDSPAPPELPEPAWLRRAYADSDDLRRCDDRSYRFVISAVLALPRELYERAGGFDAGFVGYGGEDWDLAHRCWLAGADLRHVPTAVAWHDGPDFAGRAEHPDAARHVKDAETLQLAHVLTDPHARGAGLLWRFPHTAVVLRGAPCAGALAATASSILASTILPAADAQLWCPGLPELPDQLEGDPRLHAGHVPREVLRRARLVVELPAPVILTRGWAGIVEAAVDAGAGHPGSSPASWAAYDVATPAGLVRVRPTRWTARGGGPVTSVTAAVALPLDSTISLEARWGGWA